MNNKMKDIYHEAINKESTVKEKLPNKNYSMNQN